MKKKACGFTHSIRVTAPLSFTCLALSYVAEKPFCAEAGMANDMSQKAIWPPMNADERG
jgi:hypothetical protein